MDRSDFAPRLSTWLKDYRASKQAAASSSSSSASHPQGHAQNNLLHDRDQTSPSLTWILDYLNIPSSLSPSPLPSSLPHSQDFVQAVVPLLEKLSTSDETPTSSPPPQQQQSQQHEQVQGQEPPPHEQEGQPAAGTILLPLSLSSQSSKRHQAKYHQPWRRTRPDITPRRLTARRLAQQQSSQQQTPQQQLSRFTRDQGGSDIILCGGSSSSSSIVIVQDDVTVNGSGSGSSSSNNNNNNTYLPHDILLAIFSHLPSRATAQQYYDRYQPSDLLACSRVNMAWRIAALSTIWQAVLLPDPFDPTCQRLLHLLASSHASAQLTGKNYDITEIIQRVEVDLLETTEQQQRLEQIEGGVWTGVMLDNISTLLQFTSPFRTLSIQLPQEIELSAAEKLAKTTSVPVLEAIVRGIEDAKIRELDMPSPMYCSVSTFPGMLQLISSLKELRVLVLGYSSRDWPLLRAILSLPLLENLCVFDSSWSNQIWIYLLSTLGPQLRGLTVLQGRRPLQGVVLRQGIAPFCRNLTSLSIPFIQLLSGPEPVLTDEDVIPVIKACHELQNINISGQRLLGDPTLTAMADLWSLQVLDIRDCPLMTGQSIQSVRWRSIERVRMFNCGEISQEFMDLILQAWRSSHVTRQPMTSAAAAAANLSSTSTASSSSSKVIQRFFSVLDFNRDVEDPVEMGWIRQRMDEPPLDLDEDHFFADWYC
ncbi:hypothetical protein EMPS_01280 [Entomortierella parvispora]|uniref:F-box domain-containing protein n=1 Tax=Entomortierella parvispora TaxID=205924 RepID=A0A9P3LSJ2_9FUNG|nr:hypothetical protein EMPS_01280 [Entomortierella parvispora]